MENSESKQPANEEEPGSKRGKATPGDVPVARSGRLSSGLALIVATVALITGGYLWYTLLYQHQELFRTDVLADLHRLEEDNKRLRNSVSANEEKLRMFGETQETLKTAMERIQSDLGRDRADWLLAETEQLLLIANRRLQLARDPTSAIAALRAADRQLELLANPRLLPVRRQLAREITALESVERTDISGIALRLGSLAETIDNLPLAQRVTMTPTVSNAGKAEAGATAGPPEAEAPAWRRAARSMWKDMQSLVRVRSNLEVEKPLLPPEQQYFLRENLRLMLYGAQYAILQSDVPVYQQNLAAAVRWIRDYYDLNTGVVNAVDQELERLHNVRITKELPDISGSLETLRKVMSTRPPQ